MISVTIRGWQEFRNQARQLVAQDHRPGEVNWQDRAAGQEALFSQDAPESPSANSPVRAPKAYIEMAEAAAMHRDPARWSLLYRVLYRLNHGEKDLMHIEVDPDLRELLLMQKAVRRDIHKMHAFVRFRKVQNESGEDHFIAWHRPDHLIVENVGPWFARRFGSMRWSILTPDRSVRWDLERLTYTEGVNRSAAPSGDALEELWQSYYASIFNPARVKVKAMKAEMPVRHWATLPETQLIPQLLAQAASRENSMRETQKVSAADFLPEERALPMLKQAVKQCEGCDLFRHATQAVFGEGPPQARVMFVGEQPGDQEDIQGRPFVGPAGKLFNQALDEAGIDRSLTYVTNAVKHFKFEPRGKVRLHKSPRSAEVAACRPWLEAEVQAVQPAFLVALGATAALSLIGKEVRITQDRGKMFPHAWAEGCLVTVHPSFLLRIPEEQRKQEEYARFVEDLTLLKQKMATAGIV